MNNKLMKNEKGFTLIEMLIAMSMGVILLGAAVYTYTKQDQVLRDENTNLQLRDFARLAMDQLNENLRMAGYGFPAGNSGLGIDAQGIDVASATTLTYKTNTENITLYASRDGALASTGVVVPLNSAVATFFVGDNVVYFDTRNSTSWREGPITVMFNNFDFGDPVNYDVIGLGTPNNFLVEPIKTGIPVMVNKYHIYTYTYNAGAKTITFTDDNGTDDGGGDDTTTTIATNVKQLDDQEIVLLLR